MVNMENNMSAAVSTRAKLLMALREQPGKLVSGSVLARELGVSRVAVWKSIQALTNAGYPVETTGSGYALKSVKDNDFLYPWEFGEREPLFRYINSTGSTMDRAREFALQGMEEGIIIAERQSAGRGRFGRTWASRQGGLYCTILDRPGIALADYSLPVMLFQISVARALSSVCGKPARLRWPNDIYIDKRKAAGILSELEGKGDTINWISIGIGVNVNNAVSPEHAASCSAILGHPVSRREVLIRIIDEAERLKKRALSGTAYSQGNRLLADEWNSMADCIGVRVAVIDSAHGAGEKGRILARGIFSGVDPAGRCIIKPDNGKGSLYFNPGPVSVLVIK